MADLGAPVRVSPLIKVICINVNQKSVIGAADNRDLDEYSKLVLCNGDPE